MIPLLRTWHFLDFERLSFSHETKKLDLNILYQCALTCCWHNQKTLQLLNYFHLQNFKNMRCGRDARAVTSATHVFELFKDENSWVAEVSSDCVNYIPGHISLIADRRKCQAQWMVGRPRVNINQSRTAVVTLSSPIILCARHLWRSAIRLIDTKYLDQASWIYDRMAASQRLKLSGPQQWNRPFWKHPLFIIMEYAFNSNKHTVPIVLLAY